MPYALNRSSIAWSLSLEPFIILILRLYGGFNSIGSGKSRIGHDNLQHLVATWTRKFSDELHTSAEVYRM